MTARRIAEWLANQRYDLAFTADFGTTPPTNVVPEPITMVLMGSGLVGVAGHLSGDEDDAGARRDCDLAVEVGLRETFGVEQFNGHGDAFRCWVQT